MRYRLRTLVLISATVLAAIGLALYWYKPWAPLCGGLIAMLIGLLMHSEQTPGGKSKLRFTIRDLFWLTSVVALSVGWWVERHNARQFQAVAFPARDRADKMSIQFHSLAAEWQEQMPETIKILPDKSVWITSKSGKVIRYRP